MRGWLICGGYIGRGNEVVGWRVLGFGLEGRMAGEEGNYYSTREKKTSSVVAGMVGEDHKGERDACKSRNVGTANTQ